MIVPSFGPARPFDRTRSSPQERGDRQYGLPHYLFRTAWRMRRPQPPERPAGMSPE